jgi:hypothetical protein
VRGTHHGEWRTFKPIQEGGKRDNLVDDAPIPRVSGRRQELVENMVAHWEYFMIEAIRKAVEALKDRIDLVFWWKDMAEKHGPSISPKPYKRYLLPRCKRVTYHQPTTSNIEDLLCNNPREDL